MATIELHLLRHAHAGDPAKWRGDDDVRPLSAKGREQAERLGRLLADTAFATDAIISSPKARARQTAELVAARLGREVVIDDRLGRPLSPQTVEALIRDAGNPVRPVLVGHDPDFSELLALLVGTAELPMRKGAIARVDIVRPIAVGNGVLRWLLPPELVPPDRG
jgi:phosphohistidine phosphatase SixA